ncbi:hypothetical protein B0A52_07147 [Exophiala mesophila]|uniref:DNA repair metallo-beta-lactamase domain-containing protein n=1 Tax=Exophiala mesophila TaxID=212818 RepID=A0A438N0D0_EXOME|nr:hypothetical protein B0A52_07147 [Exophiala mesophila]
MSKTPVLGRQIGSKIPSTKKGSSRPNQSILNFFAKSDKSEINGTNPATEAPLFYKDVQHTSDEHEIFADPLPQTQEELNGRFNEVETPVKRRRIEDWDLDTEIRTPSPQRKPLKNDENVDITESRPSEHSRLKTPKRRGGFVDDSSDEEGEVAIIAPIEHGSSVEMPAEEQDNYTNDSPAVPYNFTTKRSLSKSPDTLDPSTIEKLHNVTERSEHIPSLVREGTSIYHAGDFGDDDFENDEFFEEGEEYMERKWMEEQRDMETGLDEDSKSESEDESIQTPQSHLDVETPVQHSPNDSISVCPICNGTLKGLSETQASSHVNACIDGTASPLPLTLAERQSEPTGSEGPSLKPQTGVSMSRRFQRSAIARPAQANPFALSKESKGNSAFSRLMSGHAEDAAWAEAASNENQSRGKPAYQRTCPFYKIMPGMYICVDAFRYGKVENQSAYFLSHFHSDHYIGLTSSWCHGPIYASKVTCNLMVQQLKVDPKWVVPLEFEKKTEVPNTKGVFVTMIPANHCPGSSLYLFEKVIGKNYDGSPKSTRILHCGDFRACPAHVSHPLLRPDVVDSVTGQTKEQVIDTCYLDTTYLTPKYAFPSQHDVIDACANMCVSLSKEIIDTGDGWEKAKAERAGSSMKKFLEQGEHSAVKDEDADADASEKKQKARGRLLVVIGTYSIGKERICLGIAKALNSKIYAPPAKMRICACLEDEELNSRLTKNPLEAQVHMQTLMEIRAETLHDYMMTYNGHFARVVGFRPTGWSYRPPTSRFTENPAVNSVLHSEGWKTRYSMRDLAPQRGSTRESNCFGVPYSEHSSFRELTMFCCALRIKRIIPTVNVGSAKSREKMKGWIEKWDLEKRKNGLYKVEVGAEGWGSGDGALRYGV